MIRRPPRSTLFPSRRSSDLLDGVSLAINAGEFVSIIGPNGAGKSTHINVLTGVLRPTAGAVTFKGRSEEHTSELQSLAYLVCRLLLEKKKNIYLNAQPSVVC